MRLQSMVITAIAAVVFFCAGCSNASVQVAPDVGEPNERAVSVTDAPHCLLGMWKFRCDADSGAVEIIPLRDADMHLNALKFLEPPPYLHLNIEGTPQISGGILDVDIGLRNPFLGQDLYTGFDVCGIVFTHGSYSGFNDPDIVIAGDGDTRVLNADGYTRWWNPAEFPHGDTVFTYKDGLLGTPDTKADFNCTVNGYKYFAEDLEKDDPMSLLQPVNRGMFSAGMKNIRNYQIDLDGGLEFNYAVDACWKFPSGGVPYDPPDDFPPGANRPEAYRIEVTELENSLYYVDGTYFVGGNLSLSINVWDHFNAGLNKVCAESLAGLPYVESLTPVGGGVSFSTYEIDLSGDNLNQNGDAEVLITVESENSGYGGILPGERVCSYFKHTFAVNSDPPPGWALTWGSVGYDEAKGVAVDSDGSVYVTGNFCKSVDFDPGPGVCELPANCLQDAYLSKFNRNGVLEWVRNWGSTNPSGKGSVGEKGVAVDGLGNIYVTGNFYGIFDFDPGPGVDEHSTNAASDAFLCKYDQDGNYHWARTWGGAEPIIGDGGYAVSTDADGNVYVAGAFCGTADFDPGPGVDEHTANGNIDSFICKFNANGDYLWGRVWGCEVQDYSYGVASGDSGEVYVTGRFIFTVDFDPGPDTVQRTSVGLYDVFISKFDSDGQFQWVQTWGGENYNGSGGDRGYGVTLDNAGDVYITGSFGETCDFDPGPGITEYTAEFRDVFLSKFDPDGVFIWARTWGDSSSHDWDDSGYGVAVDVSGNAYVTGSYGGNGDFDPGPGTDIQTSNGELDIFLSKFDTNGNYQWARTWGGEEEDIGYAVALDIYGNPFVVGDFQETVDFDAGTGVDVHISNGYYDAFLTKFTPDGTW